MQLDSRGRPDPCQVLQVIITTKSIWMFVALWAGHNVGSESVLNLIVGVVVSVGITWSTSVSDVT